MPGYPCVSEAMEREMLKEGDTAPAFSARPIFGYPVEIPQGLTDGPIVLCFVPFLGSPFARRTLAMLQERYADFDRRGIRIVAITQTDLTAARDFVPRFHLLYPLITDPDGTLQSLFAIQEDRYMLSSLRSVMGGNGGSRRWNTVTFPSAKHCMGFLASSSVSAQ